MGPVCVQVHTPATRRGKVVSEGSGARQGFQTEQVGDSPEVWVLRLGGTRVHGAVDGSAHLAPPPPSMLVNLMVPLRHHTV